MRKYIWSIAVALSLIAVSCGEIDVESPDKPLTVSIVNSGQSMTAPILVGDEVTVMGTGLHSVAKVMINDSVAQVIKRDAVSITFKVPGLTIDAGKPLPCTLALFPYSADYSAPADNSAWSSEIFAMIPPTFKPWVQKGVVEVGHQVTLNGKYLDVVKSIYVNDTKVDIVSQIDTVLVITVPEDASTTNAITANYGDNSEFSILVTKTLQVSVAGVPLVLGMTPQDGVWGDEDIRYYLGKEVTVAGASLQKIDSVRMGVLKANIKECSPDGKSMVFYVPEDFDYNTAKSEDVIFFYGDGQADNGAPYEGSTLKSKAMVYPFFYWKGLYLKQSPDFRFLSLDEGRVVSANEWYDSNWDAIARSSTNTTNALQPIGSSAPTTHFAGQKPNPDVLPNRDTYLSVKPYLFINNKALFIPSNGTQLSSVKYYTDRELDTQESVLGSYYNSGTPMFLYRSQAISNDLPASVVDLSFKSIMAITKGSTSGGAKALKAGEVILYQYLPFDGKSGVSDSYKIAVIKCTAIDTPDSNSITIDVFWPKKHRFEY